MLKLQITSKQGATWVSWCKSQLYSLTELRKKLNISVMKRNYILPDNRIAQIISSDICDLIQILDRDSGFICHARSDEFVGGLTSKGKAILDIYDYPLIDDDDGSFILTSNGKMPPTWVVERNPENYGNLDWLGAVEVGDEVNTEVLSWRGIPGRQIPLADTVNISGLSEFIYSTVDNNTGEVIDHFTCAKGFIYDNGSLVNSPVDADAIESRVLGASRQNGVLVLICSVKTKMVSPNGTPIYRERVYIQDGVEWRTLYDTGGAPTHPFFFSADGQTAIWGSEKYSIDNEQAVKSSLSGGVGTIIYNTSPYNVIKNGSWPFFWDADLNSLLINFDSQDKTEASPDFTIISDEVRVYYPGTEPVLSITGNIDATVGTVYSVSSSDSIPPQDVVWGFSGGTIDSSGTILTSTGCGIGTVSATDICGRTASKQVRLPTNSGWVLTDSEHIQVVATGCTTATPPAAGCNDATCGNVCTVDNGVTKTEYVYCTMHFQIASGFHSPSESGCLIHPGTPCNPSQPEGTGFGAVGDCTPVDWEFWRWTTDINNYIWSCL